MPPKCVAAYRNDPIHGKALIGPKGCKIKPLKTQQNPDKALRLKAQNVPGQRKEQYLPNGFLTIGKNVQNQWQRLNARIIYDSGWPMATIGMAKEFYGNNFAPRQTNTNNRIFTLHTQSARNNEILFQTRLYYGANANDFLDVNVQAFDDPNTDIILGNDVLDTIASRINRNVKVKLV